MSHALSFAEIDAQQVELLPARTVMSAFQGCSYTSYTCHAEGGAGGDCDKGGHANGGSGGQGGDGGDAYASVHDNVNNGFIQINVAIAEGGHGGDTHGGDGGKGGDVGSGGYDVKK